MKKEREHGQTAATRILPVSCEICTQRVDQPTSMNFVSWGGKQVRWLICEGCTLILTNHIKKMARQAAACKHGKDFPCRLHGTKHSECDYTGLVTPETIIRY